MRRRQLYSHFFAGERKRRSSGKLYCTIGAHRLRHTVGSSTHTLQRSKKEMRRITPKASLDSLRSAVPVTLRGSGAQRLATSLAVYEKRRRKRPPDAPDGSRRGTYAVRSGHPSECQPFDLPTIVK